MSFIQRKITLNLQHFVYACSCHAKRADESKEMQLFREQEVFTKKSGARSFTPINQQDHCVRDGQ